MSEIRSWDRWASTEDFVSGVEKLQVTNYHKSEIYNIPVRVVAWPEGAPNQEDIPQAGEKVRRKDVAPEHASTFTIQSGIPYLYQNDKWYLRVMIGEGNRTISERVDNLVIVSPISPQTYTEEEIREAMKREIDLGTYYEDKVMDRLQKK